MNSKSKKKSKLTRKQQQNHGFHDDIVLEILSRSSVKSLLRFRCVCKRWKSLISSYSFRKMHRERHNSTTPVFLSSRSLFLRKNNGVFCDLYISAFDLYGNVVQQEYRIPSVPSERLNMMNSPTQSKLVCFSNGCYSEIDIFLCNPSTRQIFPLPSSPSSPDYEWQSCAFGYIQSKDEYIMVHMFQEDIEYTWICDVLTFSISDDNFKLQFNEWKSIEVTTMLAYMYHDSGVYARGAFYWVVCSEEDTTIDYYILSFDVETETFSNCGSPPSVSSSDMELLELNDEVYIVHLPENKPSTLDLWKLSSDVNNRLWTYTLNWNIDLQSVGCTTKTPFSDLRIMIYKLRYLLGNIEPCDFSRELEKLELREITTNRLGGIHTNLFTL